MTPIVVLTRFNLAIKYRYPKLYKGVPKEKSLWLDEVYLEKRFELFDRYTFPSFCHQTDHDYRWIVMFHKDTPEIFVKKIEQYKSELSQFEPWFMDDNESETFESYVIKKLQNSNDSEGIITVRVDNDDMVHSTFIEKIRTGLNDCKEKTVLSFRNGLQYDTNKQRCMRYSYVNNHFIALYSKCENNMITIFSFEHPEVDHVVDKEHKIVLNEPVPMWVEIVSGTNCVNEIWCRPSKVFIPYCVKREYPNLELKWDTKFQWICSILSNLPIAFARMFVDVVRLSIIRIKDMHH